MFLSLFLFRAIVGLAAVATTMLAMLARLLICIVLRTSSSFHFYLGNILELAAVATTLLARLVLARMLNLIVLRVCSFFDWGSYGAGLL